MVEQAGLSNEEQIELLVNVFSRTTRLNFAVINDYSIASVNKGRPRLTIENYVGEEVILHSKFCLEIYHYIGRRLDSMCELVYPKIESKMRGLFSEFLPPYFNYYPRKKDYSIVIAGVIFTKGVVTDKDFFLEIATKFSEIVSISEKVIFESLGYQEYII